MQLGDGTTTNRSAPVRFDASVAQITRGGAYDCIREVGGDVLCWGANHRGQFGDGTTESRSAYTPVRW